MHPPFAEKADDSHGDADDESVRCRPTKKSLATAALSLAEIPKGWPRSIKQAYISSADEESNDTDADAYLLKANKHAPNRAGRGTDADHSDQEGCQSESDDRLPQKSLGKSVRVEAAMISPKIDSASEDQLMVDLVKKVSHYRKASAAGKARMPTAQVAKGSEDEIGGHTTTKADHWSTQVGAGQQARGFGPHSTHRGLEHLHASTVPAVQNKAPRKTRAKRNASAMVPDQSPKKTKTTGSATRLLSDAPAKCTGSNVNNALGTRLWQKPKRYATMCS
ncbi:hypothetical protein BD769DRAFT_1676983 [Suillus cothurnatus]|nr:hypothetical protein BD769DRAFT_1676983 [Suillus cothurnatus]